MDNSETEGYPFIFSGMKDLRIPSKPLYRNEIEFDARLISNEDSEGKDYHTVTGANRQLHRQSSQNPQSLKDTYGSHTDPNTSTSTAKSLDPVTL